MINGTMLRPDPVGVARLRFSAMFTAFINETYARRPLPVVYPCASSALSVLQPFIFRSLFLPPVDVPPDHHSVNTSLPYTAPASFRPLK